LGVFARTSLLSVVAAWSLLVITVAAAAADPVTVRYPEGETHGFLVLRSLQGQTIAYGELTALAKGDRMESRLTWRFRDGSLQDEFVTIATTSSSARRERTSRRNRPGRSSSRSMSTTG